MKRWINHLECGLRDYLGNKGVYVKMQYKKDVRVIEKDITGQWILTSFIKGNTYYNFDTEGEAVDNSRQLAREMGMILIKLDENSRLEWSEEYVKE